MMNQEIAALGIPCVSQPHCALALLHKSIAGQQSAFEDPRLRDTLSLRPSERGWGWRRGFGFRRPGDRSLGL